MEHPLKKARADAAPISKNTMSFVRLPKFALIRDTPQKP
jgi:hypothetical protein